MRTLATHLVDDHRFHRLVIDPAAENAVAIACYAKVGFRPVGVMRRYERGADGSWHDGLLMDLLAEELVRGASSRVLETLERPPRRPRNAGWFSPAERIEGLLWPLSGRPIRRTWSDGPLSASC